MNSKIIILRYESKSVTHSVPFLVFYVSRSWDQTITNTISWLLFSEFVVSSEEDMISLFRTRHWTRWEIAEWEDLFFQNCIDRQKVTPWGEGVNDFVTTGNKTWNNGRGSKKFPLCVTSYWNDPSSNNFSILNTYASKLKYFLSSIIDWPLFDWRDRHRAS